MGGVIAEPTTEEVAQFGGLLTDDERDVLAAHEAAIRDRDFILRWERYAASRTDAPRDFHRLNAYVLTAAAVDRAWRLDLSTGPVYPNVYVLALAGSGERKSTALALAEDVARLAFAKPPLVLANEYSPEGLLADLAVEITNGPNVEHPRAQSRGVLYGDEAGRLFGMMGERSYGAGLKDILAHAWGAKDEYARRIKLTRYTLRSLYLNMILTTTISRFVEKVTPEDVASGFLPRFLPAVAVGPFVRRPVGLLSDAIERERGALAEWLGELRRTAKPGAFRITPAALARCNATEPALMDEWAARQYHADLIRPWAQRLIDYVYRLALLFAVSEGADAVDYPHVLRAVAVADRAKEDVQLIVTELTKGKEARQRDRIDKYVRANPGISARDISNRTGIRTGELRAVLAELEELERVKLVTKGRQTLCWPAPTTVGLSIVENVGRTTVGLPVTDNPDNRQPDSRVSDTRRSDEGEGRG